MPVSRNRKNHKQKSAARSLGIRNFRKSVQKMYQSAMASKIQLPTGDPLGAQEALNQANDATPVLQEPRKPETDPLPSV